MDTKERLGLTSDERRVFEQRGLLKLAAAVPRPAVAEMTDRLWAELARKDGVQRGQRGTWRQERVFGFQALHASGVFRGMASPRVRAALDDLMGAGCWAEPADWGQPLVCFPTAGEWSLPRQNWHFDGPIDPAPQRRLIGRVFLILEPLSERGGATLVATGSHRIAMAQADAAGVQQSSHEMRKRLQGLHPWFEQMMHGEESPARTSRYMDGEVQIAGVTVRVQEMTGAPGDVWLMHHNALHAPSANALARPRLVLSQFVMAKA
jgi:hypothetical protein